MPAQSGLLGEPRLFRFRRRRGSIDAARQMFGGCGRRGADRVRGTNTITRSVMSTMNTVDITLRVMVFVDIPISPAILHAEGQTLGPVVGGLKQNRRPSGIG